MSVDRKQLGAFYTPTELVDVVVANVLTPEFVAARTAGGRIMSVLDPACGDGRFLRAAGHRIRELGGRCLASGVDVDRATVDQLRTSSPEIEVALGDALGREWPTEGTYDLVIGNPPFLSQLARRTTRGGSSSRGGGPYADAAVEFLALAADLVDPAGGRVAFVLPQSLLSSRDASEIRARVDERASMIWSWWTGERVFDAQVNTCALVFEFGRPTTAISPTWSHVVTRRRDIPPLPSTPATQGRLGDRAQLNANFRDEYYGMAPAVGDHDTGPALITSGLIDPGRTLWGERPITFARQRWERPRLDLDALDPKMREWARRRSVPKVLVANQTKIIEAVCDPSGCWLPAVPVIAAYPRGAHWDDVPAANDDVVARAWEIAAVLTSGYASAWLWHRQAGTGLSADSVRLSPTVLAELPWPSGDLGEAVAALRAGDVRGCAAAVDHAAGAAVDVTAWWCGLLAGIEARQPAPTVEA